MVHCLSLEQRNPVLKLDGRILTFKIFPTFTSPYVGGDPRSSVCSDVGAFVTRRGFWGIAYYN